MGELNALKVFHLSKQSNLEELLSAIGRLSTFEKSSFVKAIQLERSTFIYWPIEYIPKASFVKAFQLEITIFIY
jgi:hypothetical protein